MCNQIYIFNFIPMTKIDENIQTAEKMLAWIVERCYELEKENKKLKALSKHKTEVITWLWKNLDELKEENRKLKAELSKLKEKYGDIDY